MSASRHAPASKDNILAQLERASPAVHPRWPLANKAGAVAAMLFAMLVMWLLVFLGQDRQQVHHAVPVASAAPPPPETLEPSVWPAAPALAIATIVPEPPTPAVLADPVIAQPASIALIPRQKTRAVAAAPVRVVRIARAAPPRAIRQPAGHAAAPPASRAAIANDGENGIDTDVALLSAILLHSPRHNAERVRAERRCNGDKACLSAMAVQLAD